MKKKEMFKVMDQMCARYPGCAGCPYGHQGLGVFDDECEMPSKQIIKDIFEFRKSTKKIKRKFKKSL